MGKKFLPNGVSSGGKVEKLEGPRVLQIQKLGNVAAPNYIEESQAAPRMLHLQMTDGHINCTAVEFSYMSKKCASHVRVDSRELDRRKMLQVTVPVKPTNDNDEFEKQRTAVIAEAAKSKETKTFGGAGGGARSNLNTNAGGNRNGEVLQEEKSTRSEGGT
ncbi:Tudor domain-containing protein 3 [Fukomys damarensis]|uniref:Tudor domain-containing protein 3 n=1 Tax=Fukomys damarensis TaxID=885580 RepID=A0A091DS50_FUKDA|nr:Tudor domain-containing protein 3 [Fukomys damarensis]